MMLVKILTKASYDFNSSLSLPLLQLLVLLTLALTFPIFNTYLEFGINYMPNELLSVTFILNKHFTDKKP